MTSPLTLYQQLLNDKQLQPDPAQASAIKLLENCFIALQAKSKPAWWQKLNPFSCPKKITGVYLYGGVGIGKTLLMDLFYRALPSCKKKRLHFHRFMSEIHQKLKHYSGQSDPLAKLAKALAKEYQIICLDEFIVTDITDAMILAGLLDALFAAGVTLIITSNLPPQELYRNGLQRERFLPAIELISRHCQVMALAATTDYRLRALERDTVYYCPLNKQTENLFKTKFSEICVGEITWQQPIEICDRNIATVAFCNDVIWFTSKAILEVPRCQRDWLEISCLFQTIFISDLEKIKADQDNLMRNFINFIDVLYDAQIKLVIQAAVPIEQLYCQGRYLFEFARTKSRLIEMQSRDYLHSLHNPNLK